LHDLEKIYGTNWKKLRANERIAIHSLYFNCTRLVDNSSTFKEKIDLYIPIKIDFAWNLAQKIGSGSSFKN